VDECKPLSCCCVVVVAHLHSRRIWSPHNLHSQGVYKVYEAESALTAAEVSLQGFNTAVKSVSGGSSLWPCGECPPVHFFCIATSYGNV
jgi:hypothetical protein